MPNDALDLGAPVPVKDRPKSPPRGGRTPVRPAYEKWLSQLQPGAEYEMAYQKNDDPQKDAHSISRLNSIRALVKELNAEPGATRIYTIDAVPVVPNKRYRIFGSVAEKPADAKKAGAAAS